MSFIVHETDKSAFHLQNSATENYHGREFDLQTKCSVIVYHAVSIE